MGLDMYLHAQREFEGEAAERLAKLAGTTVRDLEKMAGRDPMRHETYIYLARWDWGPAEELERASAVEEAAGLLPLATDESKGGGIAWRDGKVVVSITCVYWRKANAVHAWFVDHCQDGVDECQETPVSREQLTQLKHYCADALRFYRQGRVDEAARVMTPRAGFFFGDAAVDEWWAEDLTRTISEVDRVLAADPSVTFTYQSSW